MSTWTLQTDVVPVSLAQTFAAVPVAWRTEWWGGVVSLSLPLDEVSAEVPYRGAVKCMMMGLG